MTTPSADLLPLEILENILNQFDQECGKSLLSAARVCWRWSSIALPILWRGYVAPSPSICRLNAMRDDGILSKYIHLIHCLTFDDIGHAEHPPRVSTRAPLRPRVRPGCRQRCKGVHDHLSFLQSDVFYRAESITSVDIRLFERELPLHAMRKLLPPNLRDLTLNYRRSCFELLETLEQHTPHLESLTFNDPPNPAIPEAILLKFIGNMPRLRNLHGAFEGLSPKILHHLENNTTLESLRVWRLDMDDRDTNFNNLRPYLDNQPMFRGLKTLILDEIVAELAELLIPTFPNLESLHLTIILRKDRALPHFFSSLKKLHTLRIWMLLPAISPQQIRDLLPLTPLINVYSACPNLKTLEYVLFDTRIHRIRLTAPEFQQVWAVLPMGIMHVCLPFSRDCGRVEIHALAKRPFLRTLQIGGKFDLAELHDWPSAPSLPSIRSLAWPADSKLYDPLTAREVKLIIKPIFPNARCGEAKVNVYMRF